MTISTKSLQHINVPLGIKMLILKEKKSSCGLIPLVLYSLWGQLSFLLLGLDSTSNVHWCRALDQVRLSGCLFSFKGYAVLQSWYLKWCSGLVSGHSALTQRELYDSGSMGKAPGLQPKGLSVPGEALVAHAPFLHSTSKGSWARRQLGFPSLGSRQSSQPSCSLRLQNHWILRVLRVPLPLWGSLCASPQQPRGAREMLELLLSICMSPKL